VADIDLLHQVEIDLLPPVRRVIFSHVVGPVAVDIRHRDIGAGFSEQVGS
jgi:hypothetical protein